MQIKSVNYRNSLAVQWLGLCALTAEGKGPGSVLVSVPGWRINIPKLHGIAKKKIINYSFPFLHLSILLFI